MLEVWFRLDAPISTSFTVMTLGVILYSIRQKPQLCAALFISLFVAKYMTALNNSGVIGSIGVAGWHALAMGVCSILCVLDFKSRSFKFLNPEKYAANYAVGVIYTIRELIIAFMLLGLLSLSTMWVVSMTFLLFQLLIVARSVTGGLPGNNNISAGFNRGGFRNMGLYNARLFNRESLRRNSEIIQEVRLEA